MLAPSLQHTDDLMIIRNFLLYSKLIGIESSGLKEHLISVGSRAQKKVVTSDLTLPDPSPSWLAFELASANHPLCRIGKFEANKFAMNCPKTIAFPNLLLACPTAWQEDQAFHTI